MPPQPPEPKPTKPPDVINAVANLANVISMTVTPFLRSHEGSRAYSLAPFTFGLMYVFADYAPELVFYIPVWILAVIYKRLCFDRLQHSAFCGRQWPLSRLVRDKTARTFEPFLLFSLGAFVSTHSPHLGELLMAVSVSLFVELGIQLEAIRGHKRRIADGHASMQFQARMMRGEDW